MTFQDESYKKYKFYKAKIRNLNKVQEEVAKKIMELEREVNIEKIMIEENSTNQEEDFKKIN